MDEPPIKGLNSPQEKRMVGLSPLKKDLKLEPKKGQVLGPMKRRDERKKPACQDQKIKGSLVGRTIEHTWIQRDSNFASFRGLDSHLSL